MISSDLRYMIISTLKKKLEQALQPQELEIDVSSAHPNEMDSELRVTIHAISEQFNNITPVQRQRLVHEILKDEVSQIHAWSCTLLPVSTESLLRKKIQLELQPQELNIINNSPAHADHYLDGQQTESHFTVLIRAKKFNDMKHIARHRLVHDILKDEIPKIHALSLKLLPIEIKD